MSSATRWLKIILILAAVAMVGMCAVAGAGIYFVAQHVNTTPVSSGDALTQFDEARARFKDQEPLVEIDGADRVKRLRDLAGLPTAPSRTTTLVVMAWDPDEGRMVNLKLPLWLLTIGQRKIDIGTRRDSFDLKRLNLDLKELERVGPLLVIDLSTITGERVLVWTE